MLVLDLSTQHPDFLAYRLVKTLYKEKIANLQNLPDKQPYQDSFLYIDSEITNQLVSHKHISKHAYD
jgi:hypothetical protein